MALKDIWIDKVNEVDNVDASDINNIAQAVIDLENNTNVVVDAQMSNTSENPVQNKVVKKCVDDVEGCLIEQIDNAERRVVDEISRTENRLTEQMGTIDANGEKLENKGVPNGYAPLDEAGKIPVKYLYNNDNPETVTYTTYGVSIDLSNSNPETSVTYTDDAVGMVGGSADWHEKKIFNKIKPCLFKNGAVVGYLNPNNFAQFEDGSDADITSGDVGDVMIEIPKIGYKISKIGTYLTVQITDDPNKKGFSYKAHTRTEDGDREKLYIGAFLGSKKNGKLRSVSGVLPLNSTTLKTFRTYAKANGAGYDLFAFYPMTLLQCLYLIMYKNLDSQTALGQGYVGDMDWAYGAKKTGATIDKGMSYGTSDQMEQMKFLGIEDFWGNLYQWIDGLVSTSDYHALVATDNFNDTGNGYTDLGALSTKIIGGYMKEPQGNNDLGFIIGTGGGSSSTYFSDYPVFGGGFVPVFGGYLGDGAVAGAFRMSVYYYPSGAGGHIGARLMYL